MTLNEFQKSALRTEKLDYRTFNERATEYVMGLCGESGEVSDIFKKYMFQGHDLSIADIVEEMGDVLWYLAALANTIGVKLDTVAERNVEKLEKRYPKGFEAERSINR